MQESRSIMAHEMEARLRTLLLAAVAGVATIWLRASVRALGRLSILAARGTVAAVAATRAG